MDSTDMYSGTAAGTHINIKQGEKPSPVGRTPEERENKWKALYQARYVLANYGTMPERRLCGKILKRMERDAKKQGEQ